MEQPIAEVLRSMEVQKGQDLMEALDQLRLLTRFTYWQQDTIAILAQRALSRLLAYRQGDITDAQRNQVLTELVRHGYVNRLDLGSASPEAIDSLVRDNLWMLEVGLA